MKAVAFLALALMVGGMAATPSASACDGSTFDGVQRCVDTVEEHVQDVLILVGERFCDFAGC